MTRNHTIYNKVLQWVEVKKDASSGGDSIHSVVCVSVVKCLVFGFCITNSMCQKNKIAVRRKRFSVITLTDMYIPCNHHMHLQAVG